MHSNLRPERCSFTHAVSSQWRKHGFQWDPRVKAPRGPVEILGCVKSPAPIGSGMGDKGFPGRGFHADAPPVCRQAPPRTLVADAMPQKTANCLAQGNVSDHGARRKGGIGGVPTV